MKSIDKAVTAILLVVDRYPPDVMEEIRRQVKRILLECVLEAMKEVVGASNEQ